MVDEIENSRYTEEQIALSLKQVEEGTPIPEVCRNLGIAKQTFYRWKNRYGGMLPSGMNQLRLPEEENPKLKKLMVDLSFTPRYWEFRHTSTKSCPIIPTPILRRTILIWTLQCYYQEEYLSMDLLI